MRARRAVVLAAVLASGALVLAGCMEPSRSGSTTSGTPAGSVTPAAESTVYVPTVVLPEPTPGEILIDGDTGTLTPQERSAYLQSGTANDLQETFHGNAAAYSELCTGKIDLVDSAQRITTGQVAQCQANGLHVVQFEIAADAFVLAIKNETDVGGDCLSVQNVNDIYRAGSPMARWSQLGGSYRALPLTAGGPDGSNQEFPLFARSVLDTSSPSLLNLRSDFKAFHSDIEARQWVFGKKTTSATPKPNGRLSFFRFSYYQLYEEELRPFEISATQGAARNCVFPSSDTITNGQYPFSRQFMITTTTRALQRDEVKEFLLHYLGNATALASAAQLVPLSTPLIEGEKDWVNGTIAAPEIAAPSASASASAQRSDEPAS
jgi:ABC-type phosphate transport system substrate-binding protein